ncbi:hypothetical protein ACTMTR_29215, partial [Klebsiella pneumoniae]
TNSFKQMLLYKRHFSVAIEASAFHKGHFSPPIEANAFHHHYGVLGIFRPKTTKCSGGPAVCGLQRGITFFEIPIWALFE